MKLPVEFATVQVQQKLPDLARYPHILVLGEQVHVPEAVYSNQGEVILGFAKMVERMCKFDPICCQKSYLTSSPINSFLTRSLYSLMLSVSEGSWNRIKKGSPSSVSSSAFSNVISLTKGLHFSEAQAWNSS